MQLENPRSLLIAAVAAAVTAALAGCVVGSAGLGDEAGTVSLPSGLTMLNSTEGECEDSVHVGSSSLAADLRPELFVEPGQNATFRVTSTPINWACIDGDSRDFHELDCADETGYVRVTRAVEGGDLLLECYG